VFSAQNLTAIAGMKKIEQEVEAAVFDSSGVGLGF